MCGVSFREKRRNRPVSATRVKSESLSLRQPSRPSAASARLTPADVRPDREGCLAKARAASGGGLPRHEGCLAVARVASGGGPQLPSIAPIVAFGFQRWIASTQNRLIQIGIVLANVWRVPQGEKRFVYVLRSSVEPARHYVGLTADVAERLTAHNAGQSVHTAGMKPWTLVVSIEFQDERVARRFEHYLKSGSGRAFAKRHFAGALS